MPDAPSLPDEIAEIRTEALALRDRLAGVVVPAGSRLVSDDIDAARHAFSVAALKLSNALSTGPRDAGRNA